MGIFSGGYPGQHLVRAGRSIFRQATKPRPFETGGHMAAFPGRLDARGRNMTLDGFGPGAPGGDYGAEDWTDIYRRQGGDGLPNRNVSGAPLGGDTSRAGSNPGNDIYGVPGSNNGSGGNTGGSGGGNTGSSGGGGVNQYMDAEGWGRKFANSAGGSGKGHSIPGVYSRNAATVSNIHNLRP